MASATTSDPLKPVKPLQPTAEASSSKRKSSTEAGDTDGDVKVRGDRESKRVKITVEGEEPVEDLSIGFVFEDYSCAALTNAKFRSVRPLQGTVSISGTSDLPVITGSRVHKVQGFRTS